VVQFEFQRGKYTSVRYARFADDLVILIDSHPRHDWLMKAVEKRIREEMAKLRVEINEEKSRIVDVAKGGSFSFLGFEYRRILSCNRKWRAYYAPKLKKRTALLAKLREIFRQNVSQPVGQVIEQINPVWSNNSSSLPRKGSLPDRRLMPLPAHGTSADHPVVPCNAQFRCARSPFDSAMGRLQASPFSNRSSFLTLRAR
jgi:hypothetical protein